MTASTTEEDRERIRAAFISNVASPMDANVRQAVLALLAERDELAREALDDEARALVEDLIAQDREIYRLLSSRGSFTRGSDGVKLLVKDLDEARAVADQLRNTAPIALYLTCPSCGARHIDDGEFAKKVHHTHACQRCGLTWRPALPATVGVAFLPGFHNDPAHAPGIDQFRGSRCRCTEIRANDRTRHFKGCPERDSEPDTRVGMREALRNIHYQATHTSQQNEVTKAIAEMAADALGEEEMAKIRAHAPTPSDQHTINSHNAEIATSGRCSVVTCPTPTETISPPLKEST